MNIISSRITSADIFFHDGDEAFANDAWVKVRGPHAPFAINLHMVEGDGKGRTRARILAAVINNDLESIPGILEGEAK